MDGTTVLFTSLTYLSCKMSVDCRDGDAYFTKIEQLRKEIRNVRRYMQDDSSNEIEELVRRCSPHMHTPRDETEMQDSAGTIVKAHQLLLARFPSRGDSCMCVGRVASWLIP